MYFPATVNAAEKTARRRSPNKGFRQQGSLPGPNVLWLCDQVRNLKCDDPSQEGEAQRIIRAIVKELVDIRWWDSEIPVRLRAIDEGHGFDRAHPRQCLAIDQRNVIRIEDLARFTSGAFHVIGKLVEERFDQNVYIMIRSKPASPRGHHAFLERHGFFRETGVNPNHIVCYKTRPETANQCSLLGVTHYISHRIEVLNHANEARGLFAFNADPAEGVKAAEGKIITPVSSWRQIKRILLADGMTL